MSYFNAKNLTTILSKTQRNRVKLLYNSFFILKDNNSKEQFWKCKKKTCKSNVVSSLINIFV